MCTAVTSRPDTGIYCLTDESLTSQYTPQWTVLMIHSVCVHVSVYMCAFMRVCLRESVGTLIGVSVQLKLILPLAFGVPVKPRPENMTACNVCGNY